MVAARNSAVDDLADQVAEGSPYAVNLDRMWRAVGSPAGHDPRSWASLAWPLLEGVKSYMGSLDRYHGIIPQDDDPVFVVGDDGERDGWEEGEMGATQIVANVYAMFLDGTDAA